MSNDEHKAYMGNVKWVTFWNAAFIVASLLTGGAFGVAAIRDDIKNTGNTEQKHFVFTNHKIDSIQHDNSVSFDDIWKEIKAIEDKKTKPFAFGNYTQHRDGNGNLTYQRR